ncbi:hypothetical protein MSAN_00888100 [Mycena sanguinolenta]|uniref:Uncharacterized protein n=1 Tax=Mycena sanguinolenta TaxID=230812 RepID=A0A8H6YX42_9AGAR|nr:hypothetical protein MSAN_00888100 [Mycena sanguinolenta]
MAESEPRLPLDLERHIFEIAGNSHFKSIPTYTLVAWRVKIWLEPILYRVMVSGDPLPGHASFAADRFSWAVQSQASSQHVTNLLISTCDGIPGKYIERLLTRCSSIQNLALILLGRQASLLPSLSAMPLRRLSIELAHLFPSAGIHFTHPLFSHITHLQLRDRLVDAQWDEWRGLASMPNLTHLASLMSKSPPIFEGALDTCPRLQVLIFLYVEANPEIGLESLAPDTRFVCMPAPSYYTDWQNGARGGDDFWVRAEKFIAQRNCGEIDRETFVLLKD